jgi:hypothetical protein
MRGRFITNHDIAEMRKMVARGRKVSRIAIDIGCSPATVYRYAGDDVRAARGRPTPSGVAERARWIVETYEATPRGERLALAGRLGFSSGLSLRVRVSHIRRQMRMAEMQAAA